MLQLKMENQRLAEAIEDMKSNIRLNNKLPPASSLLDGTEEIFHVNNSSSIETNNKNVPNFSNNNDHYNNFDNFNFSNYDVTNDNIQFSKNSDNNNNTNFNNTNCISQNKYRCLSSKLCKAVIILMLKWTARR